LIAIGAGVTACLLVGAYGLLEVVNKLVEIAQ
jgi:hypothetical protein